MELGANYGDSENYYGCKTFDNTMDAKNFIENLFVNIKVSSSKYHVIKDFYDATEYMIKFINTSASDYMVNSHFRDGHLHCGIDGNYEGTEFEINIEKEKFIVIYKTSLKEPECIKVCNNIKELNDIVYIFLKRGWTIIGAYNSEDNLLLSTKPGDEIK